MKTVQSRSATVSRVLPSAQDIPRCASSSYEPNRSAAPEDHKPLTRSKVHVCAQPAIWRPSATCARDITLAAEMQLGMRRTMAPISACCAYGASINSGLPKVAGIRPTRQALQPNQMSRAHARCHCACRGSGREETAPLSGCCAPCAVGLPKCPRPPRSRGASASLLREATLINSSRRNHGTTAY